MVLEIIDLIVESCRREGEKWRVGERVGVGNIVSHECLKRTPTYSHLESGMQMTSRSQGKATIVIRSMFHPNQRNATLPPSLLNPREYY